MAKSLIVDFARKLGYDLTGRRELEKDQLQEIETPNSQRHWRPALISCSVFTVFILLILTLVLASFYRSPYYRELAQCRIQIQAVGDALGRYAIKNDAYPEKLTDLVPDYISKERLHCPNDNSSPDTVSFEYTRLSLDAPDKAILLRCHHHKIKKSKFPGVVLHYSKDGTVGLTPVKEK